MRAGPTFVAPPRGRRPPVQHSLGALPLQHEAHAVLQEAHHGGSLLSDRDRTGGHAP